MKRIGMAAIMVCAVSSVSTGDAKRPPPKKPEPPPPSVIIEDGKALTASSLEAGTVTARIKAQYLASIRSCYGAQLGQSPGAKGQLVLAFQVTARGATAAVRVSSFDPRIDACVAGQAAAWTFPIPTSRAGAAVAASFEVSFQLGPKAVVKSDVRMSEEDAQRFADLLTSDSGQDAVGDLSSRRPPTTDLSREIDRVREGGKSISVGGGGGASRGGGGGMVGTGSGPKAGDGPKVGTGGTTTAPPATPPPAGRVTITSKRLISVTTLSEDTVAAKINAAYMAGIRRCYQQRLKQDPSARGKVTLSFEVGETGRLVRPKARGFEASLDACIEQHMAHWRFPVPKDSGGEATTASFQIDLALVPN